MAYLVQKLKASLLLGDLPVEIGAFDGSGGLVGEDLQSLDIPESGALSAGRIRHQDGPQSPGRPINGYDQQIICLPLVLFLPLGVIQGKGREDLFRALHISPTSEVGNEVGVADAETLVPVPFCYGRGRC